MEDEGGFEDLPDLGLVEPVIIIGVVMAIVFLLYYRQQRQVAIRQEEEERQRQQQGLAQHMQGFQPAVDRGFFPPPGDPDQPAWLAGGIGH